MRTKKERGKVVQEALNVTSDNDFEGPQMAKVAKRFGISQSTIDRYFNRDNKSFDSVLHVINSKLNDNLKAVYEERSDPLKQLELILMRHTELLRENPSIPRLMLSEDVFSDSPEKKTKVQKTATDYVAKLTEIVSQSQRNNELRSDIEPDTVSLMLLGTIQLGALLFHFSSGGFDVLRLEKWRGQ